MFSTSSRRGALGEGDGSLSRNCGGGMRRMGTAGAAVVGIAVACCVAVPGLVAPASALAAKITVNTTADIVGADGRCSLREAIAAANTDVAPFPGAGECAAGSGQDTILVPAGTYKLAITGASEDNDATGDLDIRGATSLWGVTAARDTEVKEAPAGAEAESTRPAR